MAIIIKNDSFCLNDFIILRKNADNDPTPNLLLSLEPVGQVSTKSSRFGGAKYRRNGIICYIRDSQLIIITNF